ncbi:phytanoyl-CoA dioxygenase family protein [Luteolibacter ambystomatis]|uniref:Phytanoyl-CoA dioxygenase family protein n=1 Tax=Luteolibacter ambystomatis TaxID=2824561 RepID=A0A975IZG3_9BACT|nr:phytanoyl-CoA dioxygenase family protein [Luteolibacter ambystomatis]QUE49665.1 phytanoyl-CoA dioxygenase family protein [Luteolibacter ambystomatis]
MQLTDSGCELRPTGIDATRLALLREELFQESRAGTRCLLDHPLVREIAIALRHELSATGHLSESAVAIQAIAFDKTAETNWKVAWHQDLMFPFARAVTTAGYDLPRLKDGVDYARPPVPVLERLLAVRLHLDDCDETNGPLRVIPGSHRHGIISTDDVPSHLVQQEAITCLAKEGKALLMRPLLLHASSQATVPKHRRVLHFVYDGGGPMTEEWHRRI